MAANNLRELAKKGDPKVIAQIIGHTLQKKGIDVQVTRENDTLSVFLESDQVRNQQTALVDFIQQGMTKLEMIDINKVKVLGVMPGETSPIWNDEIVLRETSASVPDLKPDLIPDMDDDAMGLDDDDDYDNDFNDDEDDQQEFNDDDQTIQITDDQPVKKKSLPLVLLLLPVLLLGALVALHFTGIYRLPFLAGDQATEPLVIEPSKDDQATPTGDQKTPADDQKPTTKSSAKPTTGNTKPATTSPSPVASSATSQNAWRDGINWAMKAATQAQTAKTKTEWNLVADDWGKSVSLLKQVPKSDPNYQKAQQKITEYQNNQAIAKKKVELAPN